MGKVFLFILLCVCNLDTYAQSSEARPDTAVHRNTGLELSAGYSLPLGAYASSDMADKESGYASGGWLVQLTFNWMGKKDFGLAVQYSYQQNPMHNAANLLFPNGIPDSIGSGSWSSNYLMAGPVFMKTIRKIHLDFKVLGGAIISSGDNFDTPDPADTAKLKSTSNVATGFAYQISAGVGYTISAHLTFKFNLSLLGGWPGISRHYGAQLLGYDVVKDPVTGIETIEPVYSAPVEYDVKKIVSTLNPSIGLVYRF
ncbi:MAG: hypothetical protein NTW16_19110 [Bacteroidetes bacterium]|nr:hypothetical protein [Bacteroidota bacterium]